MDRNELQVLKIVVGTEWQCTREALGGPDAEFIHQVLAEIQGYPESIGYIHTLLRKLVSEGYLAADGHPRQPRYQLTHLGQQQLAQERCGVIIAQIRARPNQSLDSAAGSAAINIDPYLEAKIIALAYGLRRYRALMTAFQRVALGMGGAGLWLRICSDRPLTPLDVNIFLITSLYGFSCYLWLSMANPVERKGRKWLHSIIRSEKDRLALDVLKQRHPDELAIVPMLQPDEIGQPLT